MARKIRALILAGDHYHEAQHAYEGVGAVLKSLGMDVAATAGYASLGREALADKDLLVILRDGVESSPGAPNEQFAWMQPQQEQAVEEFVLNGGAFLALHNAGWGYPWKGGYRRTLGGYYVGHPPIALFHVDVVNKSHPVTAGVESYDIVDEQHFLYCDYERVQVLLVSQGQDGRQSVAGWAYEYGQGRVVYLPHGHTLEVIVHPAFQKLLNNAARWLLHLS
jgi:type 1 glutamine amidotransferase